MFWPHRRFIGSSRAYCLLNYGQKCRRRWASLQTTDRVQVRCAGPFSSVFCANRRDLFLSEKHRNKNQHNINFCDAVIRHHETTMPSLHRTIE